MYQYIPIGALVNSSVASPPKRYTIPDNANGALVQAITQNVRISLDPATPASSSVGFQIKAGDAARLIPLGSGKTFTAEQETATAVFTVQYVKIVWIPLQ